MKTEFQTLLGELRAMRLSPMAACLEDWVAEPANRSRTVIECIQEMIDAQRQKIDGSRVKRFFHQADLPPSICLSGVRASAARGLDARMVAELGTCEWVRHGHQVEYHRLAELWDTLDELERKERKKFIMRLTKVPLLVLDDFAAQKISAKQGYDLLKILDARSRNKRSTLVASPSHRQDWETYFEDATTADLICVRLDRAVQVIELKRITPP